MAVLCVIHKIRWSPCTLFILLYLPLPYVYQCGLHAVLWLHNGILKSLFDENLAEHAALLILYSQYLCETILLTICSMAGFKSRAKFFIGLHCSFPFFYLYCFSFSLHSITLGLCCGAGIFRLIECQSTSRSALHCLLFSILIVIEGPAKAQFSLGTESLGWANYPAYPYYFITLWSYEIKI